MKKNNSGFALVETLIVSIVVATILIYIYVQYTTLQNNYDESFRYNDVDDLYELEQIKNYINTMPSDMKSTITNSINTNSYAIITINSGFDFVEQVLDDIGAKYLIITYADPNDIDTTDLSNNVKKMLKKINNKSSNYRLIIEYENNNIATMTFKMEGV